MKAAIIPVYNDGETIGALVDGALKHVDLVVVVDDGSEEPVTIAHDNCIVLTHYENMGKGAALRTAISYLRYTPVEQVVLLDGDGEHNPGEIPSLLAGLGDAQVVLGYRDKHRSTRRRVINSWMGMWFRLLHPEVRDPSCGMRAFRWSALDQISLSTDDFRVDAELVLSSVSKGFEIVSVPISVKPREESRVTLQDFLEINNYFDNWVLLHAKNLKLPMWRRGVLTTGARIGKIVGERLHAWIS